MRAYSSFQIYVSYTHNTNTRRKETVSIYTTVTYLYYTITGNLLKICIVHIKARFSFWFSTLNCVPNFYFILMTFLVSVQRLSIILFNFFELVLSLHFCLEICDRRDNELCRNSNSWRRPCCAYLTCMSKLLKRNEKKIDVGLECVLQRTFILRVFTYSSIYFCANGK